MTFYPENLIIESIPLRPKGGQHCGVDPQGVKVTHIPTGLQAYCHSERSRTRNTNIALSMIEWAMTEIGIEDHRQ